MSKLRQAGRVLFFGEDNLSQKRKGGEGSHLARFPLEKKRKERGENAIIITLAPCARMHGRWPNKDEKNSSPLKKRALFFYTTVLASVNFRFFPYPSGK